MKNTHSAKLTPKNGVRFQVVSYERVSNEERLTGSHTFETQSQRIQQKLDQVLGCGNYDLKRFVEDGVSGHFGPRPTKTERRTRKVLKDALDELSTGKADVFVVYHTNRLARNTRVFLEMCEDDILPNAAFLSATEALDMTTGEGRAMAGIGAIFATMQRDSIVARNRDAAVTRVQAGYYLGQVPYGWQWEPVADIVGGRRCILPIPEQGKWIVQMKDWYLSGWSTYKITTKLNALGVPPPSATKPSSRARHDALGRVASGKWSAVIVWRTLSNPLHAGLVPARGTDPVAGKHYEDRYFDPDVRDQILATAEKRKRIAPTNTGNRHDNRLLNGLVLCARCGKRMYPTWHCDKKYHVYRCMTGLATGTLTCPGVSAREDELDTAIVERIARVAEHPQMRSMLLEEADDALDNQDEELCRQRVQLTQQLEILQRDLSQMFRLAARGMMNDTELARESAGIRAEEEAARDALAKIETALASRTRREAEARKVRELVLQFDRVWKHLGLDERREVMRGLIEKLTLDRNDAGCSKTGNTRVETTVTLKLVLLPEETFALVHDKVKRVERTTIGVAGLTPRHLSYLHWIGEGKTGRESAELMKISHNTIRIYEQQIRKRLSIHDMTEAARMATGMIHAKRSTLSLEGHVSPQVTKGNGSLYLSDKLMQVLPLYASGASTEEVASLTGLSRSTVMGRRARILETTYSKTLYEAVQKARAAGYAV